jgi:hypothetical protein
MADRFENVTRQHYEPLVTQARELIAQVPRARFVLGDMALEIEPMLRCARTTPSA